MLTEDSATFICSHPESQRIGIYGGAPVFNVWLRASPTLDCLALLGTGPSVRGQNAWHRQIWGLKPMPHHGVDLLRVSLCATATYSSIIPKGRIRENRD